MSLQCLRSPHRDPFSMELYTLPYVVLRELLPMLDLTSKRVLRLVSHRFRDLIDSMKNTHFIITFSDETSDAVFKFKNFDLEYFSRVLHRLQVTTLTSPLEFSSTSLSRCPLPPFTRILAFTKNHGVSQSNFLVLLNFYGRTDDLKTLQVNMHCLEKMDSIKAIGQGLSKLNLLHELELKYPPSMDTNIDFGLTLLRAGNYGSLQILKIDLSSYGCYHPILYQNVFMLISRQMTRLTSLELIQPRAYVRTGMLRRFKDLHPHRIRPFLPKGVELMLVEMQMAQEFGGYKTELLPFFDFHHRNGEFLEIFRQGFPHSLRKLTMKFCANERFWKEANLGLMLVNCQQKLEILELSNFRVPNPVPTGFVGADPLNLARVLQSCSTTLVTLKLLHCTLPRDNFAQDENEDGPELPWPWEQQQVEPFNFNLRYLENCHLLKTFVFTTSPWERMQIEFQNVEKLPTSLEHLELPSYVYDEDLESIQERLTKLKSFAFGYQFPQVDLEKIQILLGGEANEGIPTLEKVTVMKGYFHEEQILGWIRDRRRAGPTTTQKNLVFKNHREFCPLEDWKHKKTVVFSRAA